ncbi:MAG: hypothetical protein IPM48_12980 [Saprospiraceae bacterium]|nr:hypothetical protein [Saprospiraceae bacterium]
MNRLFLFALCSISMQLSAQITLTNRILPALGDSYIYHLDTVFNDFTAVDAQGPDKIWDLSGLQRMGTRTDLWVDPSASRNSSLFPNANLVFRTQGVERFYRVSANRMEELGFGNAQPMGGPFGNFPNIYPSPVLVFTTPSEYQDGLNHKTETSFTIPANFLPDTILSQFPGGIRPDSIRIKNKADVSKVFDSWGQIKLPVKTWDVLREKRTTVNSGTIEAKLGFLGWIDVTVLAGPVLGGISLSNTSIDYVFYSNDSKGFIASVSSDTAGNINSVLFKPDQSQVSTQNAGKSRWLELKSNLVQEELTLKSYDLPVSEYWIEVLNPLGQRVFNRKMTLQANLETRLQLDFQGKGQFLLVVHSTSLGQAMYFPFYKM